MAMVQQGRPGRSGSGERSKRSRLGLAIAAGVLVLTGLPLVLGASAGATPASDGNGDLAPSCGLDVTLVLDDSGSISSGEGDQVRAAAQSFASALVGTPSTLKTVVFASRATGINAGGTSTSNLNNIVFRDPADYSAPTSGGGSGGTNWDDALEVVRRSNGGPGDLVVFITDGDPTYRNEISPDGHANDGSHALDGDGSTIGVAANLNQATYESGQLKNSGNGTHMFGIGVGLTANGASEQRLNDVTGDDEMTITAGVPNISFGEADYIIAPNFSDLQEIVDAFTRELCGDSLNVTKFLQKADGTTVQAGASDPWDFTASLTPAPDGWTSPATGTGSSATQTTDANGGASFVWDRGGDVTAHEVDLTEAPKPGWVYNGARCTLNDLSGADPTVIFDTVGANVADAQGDLADLQDIEVPGNEAVNCDVYNRQLRTATIQVVKQTVPAGLAGDFDFTLSQGQASVDVVTDLSHGETGTFDPVPAGTYTVTEGAVDGFTNTAATCDDLATQAVETASPVGLEVGEGETWRCRFTNTAQPGSITVVKHTVGADGTFGFTSNVSGLGNFSLTTVAGTASTAKTSAGVGTYNIAETVPAKWSLTGATCTGGDAPSAVTVDPGEDVTCTFTNTAPDPTITVEKSAGVASVGEPGGPVTYSVKVTNTSVEPLIITELTDSIEGGPAQDITTVAAPITATTCATGTGLAIGASYSCTFTATVSGNGGDTVEDAVFATAVDSSQKEAEGSDGASVAITDVAPTLQVDKSASVASIAEPGGSITYTVDIDNSGGEAVIIDTITDSIEGGSAIDVTQVAGPITATTCDDLIGDSLAAGATVSCTFTVDQVVDRADVPDGFLDDTVTVGGHDDDGKVDASASAKVAVTDVKPSITVTKTATPSSVAETAPGQTRPISYLVTIQNDSAETVTIGSITDSVEGGPGVAVTGTCDDLIGTTLAPQASTSCTFAMDVAGNAGDSADDVVTVEVTDNDQNSAGDADDASVTFTDLPSSLLVEKTANVGSVPEPGGPVTYTVKVTNTSASDSVTLGSIVDAIDGGAPGAAGGTCPGLVGDVLAPGASTTCSFTLAVTGNAGDTVPDTVTVTGTDDDGGSVSDSGDESVDVTDVPSSITVDKVADVASVPENGGPVTYTVTVTNTSVADSVTIDAIVDSVSGGAPFDVAGTCDGLIGDVLAPGASTTCTFTIDVTGNAGDAVPDTVTVTGTDDDDGPVSGQGSEIVDITDVGSTIVVDKSADVASVSEPGGPVTYTVTVTNTSDADSVTIDAIVDSVSGGAAVDVAGTCDDLIGDVLAPGASTTCTFTMTVDGNAGDAVPDTVTVTGTDDDDEPVSGQGSEIVDITDVLPEGTVTKTADPGSVPETGGPVVFTVSVTNTSDVESATVTSITDEVGGELIDVTTVAGAVTATDCAAGAVLAPGGTYTCSFTLAIAAGQAGDEIDDTVTVTLEDDEGNAVEPTDTETVTLTDVAPTITVTKDNGDAVVPAPGGPVDFTVTVTNTSAEPVTLTGLTDAIDGGDPIDITVAADPITATDCATGGVIQPGATYTCTFTATVASDEAATVPDEVTATVVDDDGNSESGGDDAVTTVTASADLAITKRLVGEGLVAGSTGEYELVVTNDGPSTAAQVEVIDQLPAGLGAVSATGEGWACAIPSPRVVRCQRDSLAAGATSTITITVRVAASAAGDTLTNVADVVAVTDDPDEANNHDEVTTEIGAVAPEDIDNTPTNPANPAAPHSGTLARTGTEAGGLVQAGLLLVLVGGMVLGLRRLRFGWRP